MEIEAAAGKIAGIETDAIVLNAFEGAKHPEGELAAADKALGGAVSQLIGKGEIKGKLGEVTIIHSLGRLPAVMVAVAGLGKKEGLTKDKVRGVMAGACRLLRQKDMGSLATVAHGAGVAGIDPEGAAQAITEGALLGTYTFRRHITKKAEHGEISKLSIVAPSKSHLPRMQKGIDRGTIYAEAANLARDMVNEPGNHMTPSDMAGEAWKLADAYGLEVEVWERERIQESGMGGLLGVAQGSQQPPKFIILRHNSGSSSGVDLALAGKGITFDSGGISIKPSDKMEEMKGDMAGGAAVIAAMGAIARLKLKANVVAVVPATENLPSGSALKPGDVIKTMSGKTVEITSTDAEGRLILADALSYAKGLNPRFIVDVATLTGACKVALGDVYTGAFGNDQPLIDHVITAGAEAGELIWQLPMHERYKEQNKSDVADIKNTGGRWGGAITAAQFLAEFVGDTPWVHLDIAGTDLSEKERAYLVKGATGMPVRTLVNLVPALVK